MLTAALKPDTALVFTFPPEWFPTEHFHWETFVTVLTEPDNPYGRYALNTALLILVNMASSRPASSASASIREARRRPSRRSSSAERRSRSR
jgi:ABC-type glycerol-3-phosphate transport system permease component